MVDLGMRNSAQRFLMACMASGMVIRRLAVAIWLFSTTLFCSEFAGAQELSIGLPEWSRDFNFLSDTFHPAAMVYQDAVAGGLLEIRGGRVIPRLVSSIQGSPDYVEWSLQLSRQAKFNDGVAVSIKDISSSLGACRSLQTKFFGLKVEETRSRFGPGLMIRLPAEQSLAERSDFIKVLAECPIFPDAVRSAMGDEFGRGTNVVSVGPFVPTDFRAGRSVELRRHTSRGGGVDVNNGLALRAFADMEHGLAALRSGTIDALFVTLDGVIAKAKEDQTLALTTCREHPVIYRRGLKFDCSGDHLHVTEMRYVD